MKALIFEDRVVDTSETPFEVHASMHWIDCPNECEAGRWSVINGVLQITPEPEVIPLTWEESRRAEYNKLNQFEMQFDDQRDDTTTWVDAINDIKDRFPK
jgi:hypothetical protein